jgi:hypothetical protein
MTNLRERIAVTACCAGCQEDEADGCLYRQQGNCDRLTAAIEAVEKAPIWGDYLVARRQSHIHFYAVDGAKVCRKSQDKARRRLGDLLRKDCSLCESVLSAVGIPTE